MERIKKRIRDIMLLLAVIGACGVAFTLSVHAQAQLPGNPAAPYKSYFDNRSMALLGSSSIVYKRNKTAVRGFGLSNPSFGLGVSTPSAALEIGTNAVFKVVGNVVLAPTPNVFTVSSTPTTLSLPMGNYTSAVITLNVTTVGNVLNIVVTNNVEAAASIPRTLVIRINYTGTQPLATLTIRANQGPALNNGIKILWPNGDAPVFTKTPGRSDIIYLYWTGPGWPTSSNAVTQPGQYYGTVSYNH